MAGRTSSIVVCTMFATLLGGAEVAQAQTRIRRLGNQATRITPPIQNTAALQKTFSDKRYQTSIAQILERAGLTSLTPQVLAVLTSGKVQETTVAPGTTIRWMGSNGGAGGTSCPTRCGQVRSRSKGSRSRSRAS